ncbi:MAG: T9SS type A sorting domain-containing protein, partial [Candidatus Cloacimonetes bacterium]|nr:T9SS type A sorting domain-containing protein [Candidatus Cloacimonadota bacterium]
EEPNLWIYSGIYTGGDGIVEQFSLPTMASTGLTHNVSEDFPGTHAGGLFCTDEFDEYIVILGGIAKGNPSYLFGYEIGYTPNAYAPEPPVDFTLTTDPGGALEVTISWINPSVNLVGNPLTELLEIRIYRNSILLYTATSPSIGEPCSYIDAGVPSSGMCFYDLIALNSYGGSSVSDSVWVGEDVPDSVSNFYGEQIDNTLSIHLTWENPTQGLHGGAFNEPILGYHLAENTGMTWEYFSGAMEDLVIDVSTPGVYYYMLTPFNIIGDGGTATSNDIIVEITGIENHQLQMIGYKLSNFPNPFKPSGAGRSPATTISFSLAKDAKNAKIVIYNIKGQKVKQILRNSASQLLAGQHSVTWNGTDENNKLVSSGVYFYRLKVNDKIVDTKKCLLLK